MKKSSKKEKNLAKEQKPNEKFSIELVCDALLQSKGLITVAADRLSCTPKTIRNYVKKYATVRAALDEASERILDIGEGRLFVAVSNGEKWAIQYLLSTKGANRGYNTQIVIAKALAKLKDGEEDGAGLDDFVKAMEDLVSTV